MSPSFTKEEVLRLAPDASSAKSGQDLAQTRKWVTLGGDDGALWGECLGSGEKPYQVQVDLSEPAFKCSCPSRKFPCKHGLGLMLLKAINPAEFTGAGRPAWVVEWLDARRNKAGKAAEKAAAKASEPAKERDPNVAAERHTERINKTRAGLAELAAWAEDLVRIGIAGVPSKGYEVFEAQARRMVDAQAPGVARLLRQLAGTAMSGSGWEQPFLEQLALLRLICVAAERWQSLPASEQADLEAVIGHRVAPEELARVSGVRDLWHVTSCEIGIDDRLKYRRVWLWGEETGRSALLLDFAFGATGFEGSYVVGLRHQAEFACHPGNGLRGMFRNLPEAGERTTSCGGVALHRELLDRYSAALAACPWLEQFGLPLLRMTPARAGEKWQLVDGSGDALPIDARDQAIHVLLALSGGKPLDVVVVEYDGVNLRPLTAMVGGHWTPLVSQTGGA